MAPFLTMPRNPKFAIVEIDGDELEGISEYEPVSEDIYYDTGKVKTVKDKIDDTALGYVDFFQYILDRDLTIPANRSKIVSSIIDINTQTLCIEGILEIS